jgi:hypothetical protein
MNWSACACLPFSYLRRMSKDQPVVWTENALVASTFPRARRAW